MWCNIGPNAELGNRSSFPGSNIACHSVFFHGLPNAHFFGFPSSPISQSFLKNSGLLLFFSKNSKVAHFLYFSTILMDRSLESLLARCSSLILLNCSFTLEFNNSISFSFTLSHSSSPLEILFV